MPRRSALACVLGVLVALGFTSIAPGLLVEPRGAGDPTFDVAVAELARKIAVRDPAAR